MPRILTTISTVRNGRRGQVRGRKSSRLMPNRHDFPSRVQAERADPGAMAAGRLASARSPGGALRNPAELWWRLEQQGTYVPSNP